MGDLQDDRIPPSLQTALAKLERDTAQAQPPQPQPQPCSTIPQKSSLLVCLALNYGGRNDILQASLKLAQLIQHQAIQASDVTEETLASLLSTKDIPDPDLIIRTSGECRLSNFMLWNAAYSELYFTPTLWPDFDDLALQQALAWYGQRQRKFGGRSSGTTTTTNNNHPQQDNATTTTTTTSITKNGQVRP